MKSIARLIALLLIGVVAMSGCSAVRSILSGSSSTVPAPAASTAGEVVAEPTAPRFKFYDSWASW